MVEDLCVPVVGQPAAVPATLFEQQVANAVDQAGAALRSAALAAAQRDRRVRVDQPVQVGAQAPHVADAAEMGEVDRLGLEREQAVNRPVQLRRVELDRCAGREDHRTPVDVQFPVGDAEGVAGEDVAAARVVDADVVTGVPGRVEKAKLASVQADRVALGRFDQPLRGHGNDLAVQPARALFSVHRDRRGEQRRRIDHVSRAPRVHGHARVGQVCQQQARRAGMVQVHMGQDHVVDLLGCDVAGTQRRDHARHRGAVRGVDDRGAPVLDDQVDRGQHRSLVAGVDRADPVVVVEDRARRRVDRHAVRPGQAKKASKPPSGSKRPSRYASRVGPGMARTRSGWRSSPG